jgi:hypothetical protein
VKAGFATAIIAVMDLDATALESAQIQMLIEMWPIKRELLAIGNCPVDKKHLLATPAISHGSSRFATLQGETRIRLAQATTIQHRSRRIKPYQSCG